MVNLDIEYCEPCGHLTHFKELKKIVLKRVPETKIQGAPGRQDSFEVKVNEELIHSKLQTLAFPDYEDVACIVEDVSNGDFVRHSKQQPIDCAVM